jgi:hypothetical protein
VPPDWRPAPFGRAAIRPGACLSLAGVATEGGQRVMIALEDCIALCGLTEEEVLAIAEHEHVPEIVACALAEYLLHQEHGSEKVRDMIVDDVRAAQARGDRERVRTLLHVLHHFLKAHPDAMPLRHDQVKASTKPA